VRRGLADGGERAAIGGEERDVGAEIGGQPFQRRLLLGGGGLRGREHVLREHGRGLEARAASVAEQAPSDGCRDGEDDQAREDGQIDTEGKPAHQSC
jgi:hypothetical protein